MTTPSDINMAYKDARAKVGEFYALRAASRIDPARISVTLRKSPESGDMHMQFIFEQIPGEDGRVYISGDMGCWTFGRNIVHAAGFFISAAGNYSYIAEKIEAVPPDRRIRVFSECDTRQSFIDAHDDGYLNSSALKEILDAVDGADEATAEYDIIRALHSLDRNDLSVDASELAENICFTITEDFKWICAAADIAASEAEKIK